MNGKISLSNLLLSVISGLLGILLFFTYNTVDRFNALVNAFNEAEKNRIVWHVKSEERINEVEKFSKFIYENTITPTEKRSVENSDRILQLETKLGRRKSPKNSPRVCDIDIIDYDGLVLNDKLSLPHVRMHERNFVLLPLFEIEKEWVHPIKKVNIKKLILSLSNKDIRSIKQIWINVIIKNA